MNDNVKHRRAAARSGEWAQHFSNASCLVVRANVCRLLDVPVTAEDDSDSAGRFSANSRAEDLQVPATAARTALLYVAITSRLETSDSSR